LVVFIPLTRTVKGYIVFGEKYVTGRKSLDDLAMSIRPNLSVISKSIRARELRFKMVSEFPL